MNAEPIAYVYEADTHCPPCARERFGLSADGFIGGEDAEGKPTLDGEGNPVGVVFSWDEWCEPTELGPQTLVCGTCHGVITEHEHEEFTK